MEKKYKLTEEICYDFLGIKLYRIEALKDFGIVKKGDKGGYIENENNLSQEGDCWIYGNTKVSDKAIVCGNAQVSGNAQVFGNATVYGNALVYGNAKVYDDAKVYEYAMVQGNAKVYGNAEIRTNACIYGDAVIDSIGDYIVFKNFWSSGRSFTWTRSNDMWKVGCFYGTGEELIKKAYKDSEISGKEYERIVKYVETIKKK